MSNLRTTLADLAADYARKVVHTIHAASLQEIMAEVADGSSTAAAPAEPEPAPEVRFAEPVASSAPPAAARPPARRKAQGRTREGGAARRSPADIARIVDAIVALLQTAPEGLRAEEIRKELWVEAKDLPRPLAEALKVKKIQKRGQKRATTYFVTGAPAPKKIKGTQ